MSARDDLGDRMKSNYENRSRYYLPRRTYTIIRVDGKAFHSFTRNYKRPFDERLMQMMNQTAIALCDQFMGAQFAYVQSDEISVLLTDFGSPQTEAWFDGNLNKLLSISASIATAAFNKTRLAMQMADLLSEPAINAEAVQAALENDRPAQFDSRAFTIPDPVEVENAFIWRQQDATRNAIQMVAQAHFSHRQIQGKDCNVLQEMLWQEKQINFNDLPVGQKRGRFIDRVTTNKDVEFTDRRTGETRRIEGVLRSEWQVVEPPIFTQDRGFLRARIPELALK